MTMNVPIQQDLLNNNTIYLMSTKSLFLSSPYHDGILMPIWRLLDKLYRFSIYFFFLQLAYK